MPALAISAAPFRHTEPTPTAPADRTTTTLADAVAAASTVALALPLDSPRWQRTGPALTTFVDAARRAADGSRSPIRPAEDVAPVLRLRDLARLARVTASMTGPAGAAPSREVVDGLRSLLDTALD